MPLLGRWILWLVVLACYAPAGALAAAARPCAADDTCCCCAREDSGDALKRPSCCRGDAAQLDAGAATASTSPAPLVPPAVATRLASSLPVRPGLAPQRSAMRARGPPGDRPLWLSARTLLL